MCKNSTLICIFSLRNLTELYIDNNLLDALPGIFLKIHSLERVHRHGNHNYFKATFMWYHTDVNDRILECPSSVASPSPGSAERPGPVSLQQLAATRVIQSRLNFFRCGIIPSRIKDYISGLCEGLEVVSALLGSDDFRGYHFSNSTNFSFAQTAQVLIPSPQPVSKCSPSRIHTWATPASPSSTGRAAWPAPGRLRCPPAGSSSWTRGSRTGSTRDMSGSRCPD